MYGGLFPANMKASPNFDLLLEQCCRRELIASQHWVDDECKCILLRTSYKGTRMVNFLSQIEQ